MGGRRLNTARATPILHPAVQSESTLRTQFDSPTTNFCHVGLLILWLTAGFSGALQYNAPLASCPIWAQLVTVDLGSEVNSNPSCGTA
jgi:hypothetical protein